MPRQGGTVSSGADLGACTVLPEDRPAGLVDPMLFTGGHLRAPGSNVEGRPAVWLPSLALSSGPQSLGGWRRSRAWSSCRQQEEAPGS